MDRNVYFKRSVFVIVFLLVCVLIFAGRLFNLQVVNGDYYLEQSERRLSRSVTVKAPRGEILDRYGRPLVTNRSSFAVKIDAVSWKKADKNKVLLDLVKICSENGQAHLDSLPITAAEPFQYTYQLEANAQNERTVVKYLRKNKWPEDSSAADLIKLICDDYDVPADATPAERRTLAGIYFEMEQRNFTSGNPFLFAEDVDVTLVTKIKERTRELPGVMIDVEPIREYQTPYAAHILGRVDVIYKEEYEQLKQKGYRMDDIVGKDGMEKVLEDYLRGQDGTRAIETTTSGKVTNVLSSKNPILGKNCVLTLDIRLQEAAEKSLAAIVPKLREEGKTNSRWGGEDAKGASLVVLDVRNGDALAMASYPSFSLKDYKKNYNDLLHDPLRPMTNRAISGLYPPGSTFKMVSSIAGLESGTIAKNTKIEDLGVYRYYAPSYTPMCDVYKTYHRTHGYVNVEEALQVSCNYFFYEVGRLMGIDTLADYAKRLGFGQKTGIEIPGESTGQVASPELKAEKGEIWYPGQTIAAAIGQSDTLVTPLQLANYVSTLCNGGVRYQPHLLKSVKNPLDNTTVYEQKPKALSTVDFNSKNVSTVLNGMQMVAMESGGSAYSVFKDYPVKVGAKTGSAQAPGGSHALFVAYAPADDPEIAIAIVVENGGQGSRIASVAKDVFDVYFSNDFDLDARQAENALLK